MVARAENTDPVVLEPKPSGYNIGFNTVRQGQTFYYDKFIVPYNFNGVGDLSAAEPTTTIEVENPDDVFMVVCAYEVRSPGWQYFESPPINKITIWLRVEGRDNPFFKEIEVYSEQGPSRRVDSMGDLFAREEKVLSRWEQAVSFSHVLSNLPNGTYGLNLIEHMARILGPREYRNMRLSVTKLS